MGSTVDARVSPLALSLLEHNKQGVRLRLKVEDPALVPGVLADPALVAAPGVKRGRDGSPDIASDGACTPAAQQQSRPEAYFASRVAAALPDPVEHPSLRTPPDSSARSRAEPEPPILHELRFGARIARVVPLSRHVTRLGEYEAVVMGKLLAKRAADAQSASDAEDQRRRIDSLASAVPSPAPSSRLLKADGAMYAAGAYFDNEDRVPSPRPKIADALYGKLARELLGITGKDLTQWGPKKAATSALVSLVSWRARCSTLQDEVATLRAERAADKAEIARLTALLEAREARDERADREGSEAREDRSDRDRPHSALPATGDAVQAQGVQDPGCLEADTDW